MLFFHAPSRRFARHRETHRQDSNYFGGAPEKAVQLLQISRPLVAGRSAWLIGGQPYDCQAIRYRTLGVVHKLVAELERLGCSIPEH